MDLPEPAYYIPPGITSDAVDLAVILPYVDGMLREETTAALHLSELAYLTVPLDKDDPYDYAAKFREWWTMPMDLVILEQDMVPTYDQFHDLAEYGADWAAMAYHVGNGQYTTGLGFCKLSRSLRSRWPNAGVNASLDPTDSKTLIQWAGLNENVERHLTRLGEKQITVPGTVTHLHYPEPHSG